MNTKGQGPLLLLRFSSFKIFVKTTGLIETKLHIEHQWGWEIKFAHGILVT